MSGITIGSNVSSLMAQRRLSQSSEALSKSSERLASGMRINQASDDAAGLAVSMSLRADARVFSQGVRNISDGISLLNIADGTLSNLSEIVIRMKELAEQAANGSYSHGQRTAMNDEHAALTEEYNRVLMATKFNGITLLDGRLGNLSIQAGYGETSGQISFELGGELGQTVGDGTFLTPLSLTSGTGVIMVKSADVDSDGDDDLLNVNLSDGSIFMFLSNGDGTFLAPTSFQTGAATGSAFSVGDLNGDHKVDLVVGENSTGRSYVFMGNGNGTFVAPVSYSSGGSDRVSQLADVNGDGKLDLIAQGSGLNIGVLLGNGNGTFTAQRLYYSGSTSGRDSLEIVDVNGDGDLDIISVDYSATDYINILIGNGDGTFKSRQTLDGLFTSGALATGDIDNDGIADLLVDYNAGGRISIYSGNADGTFRAPTDINTGLASAIQSIELQDLDGDGILDVIAGAITASTAVMIGNSDGSFRAARTYSGGGLHYSYATGDFNGDGALDIVGASNTANTLDVLIANPTTTTRLARTNISTQTTARSTMNFLDSMLQRIAAERGAVGSSLSRYSTAMNVLRTQSENILAAESRIMSSDIAEESGNLIKNRILRETGASILAQANQQPALALQLLRG